MAQRKSNRPTKFERSYRILEYLKKHTDSEHTITQAALRRVPEVAEYIGDKETYNDTVVNMAMAMNFDQYDVKPREDWKIIFKEFERQFGSDVEDDDFDDELDSPPRMPIRGLHYNHLFSYEEINALIEGILFSKTVDTETANQLISKIEDNLTTKYYPTGPKKICTVQEILLVDRDILRDNLLTIQQAIDDNVQISFQFNGYNHKKELKPVRDKRDTVSPYYIVANGGRYYLLACKEIVSDQQTLKNMSIWRIDLMTDVEIPERDEKKRIKGIQRVNKKEVENLPREWSEDFQLSHLNMSYDKPIPIILKIKSPKREGSQTERLKLDYTFMYDWFGDTFRYLRTEDEAPFDDIVQVTCSPFAMVNWALQYSDRVEVLEPNDVRDSVIGKIKRLNEKYGV
ncbi:WYL domain-containing protein [Amphibacillus indicireducens]|uniref:WYL domain-containing protein n=1 Tax=Amphibacillus indicireducens TaxID=1076330 RepID=A0ABP7VYH8_9BACI